MYDFIKLRISDPEQASRIINLTELEFNGTYNKSTGEATDYPIWTSKGHWKLKAFSPTLLEISGSLHKYYSGGINYDDFKFHQVREAINKFSKQFCLNPSMARIVNLEFGVNLKPHDNASDIIRQIVTCSNKRPIRPYEDKPNCYYVEFQTGEAYVKLYDKGLQCNIDNTLRFEVKAMRNRYLQFANINSLADLLKTSSMPPLAVKLEDVFSRIIFKDDTINIDSLSKADKKVYIMLKDPNEWAINKGNRTQTDLNRANRFRKIVDINGNRRLYGLKSLVKNKAIELC